MKSFVVQTYYQLMHSMALALTLEEKPCLYFAVRYLDAGEDFLDRIRETGVFSRVTAIDGRGDLTEFIAQLHKTNGMAEEEIDEIGDSLFEEFLEPYYSELFTEADMEDEIIIYNDYHWYFYYVSKHFKYIVGAEDGYASLTQQLKIHKFAGDRELVKPFLGKYYPEPGFRHPSVCGIISSRDFDDLPGEYREKLKVVDFKDLVEENRDAFARAVNRIFETEDLDVEECDVLFLAQALARSTYCLSIEEYLLNRKIIRRETEKGRRVCFKSHPADSIDGKLYKDKNVRILPGTFPVEVLNYKDHKFEKTLSFGSTGVETLTCSESTELLYGDRSAERKDVEEFIKKLVKGEKVVIDVCVIVRDIDADSLVHAYSAMITGDRYIETRLRILVPEEMADEAGRFFKPERLPAAIDQYRKTHLYNGVCLSENELKSLKKHSTGLPAADIVICDCPEKSCSLLETTTIGQMDCDYLFFVDQDNLLFQAMKSVARSLRKQIVPCVVFPSYSLIKNKKMEQPWISSTPGFIDRSASGSLMNKVIHRVVAETMREETDRDPFEVMESFGQPTIWFSNDLYIPTEWFTEVEEGEAYYSGRIAERVSVAGQEAENAYPAKHIAEDIYGYLNWLQLSDRKYGADEIDLLLNSAEISDCEKIRALEELCSTLYFEKYRRFRSNFGPDHEARKYLKEKLGLSRKTLDLITAKNRIKKFFKR